ncbi:MAG: SGNH/GDSL hydrolase family protein [Acidimicrobiia bacterium]|nr:SGNH/GDSL hydrolase family protein [Acidimicrobiia bacterium]
MIDTIALVGDSIRLSYQPYAAARLRPQFVWGPADNCRSSRYLLRHIDRLVLDHLHDSTLVHFNVGAHDVKRLEHDGFGLQVQLEEYRSNVAELIAAFRAHPRVARVVVATTAPVDDIRHKTLDWLRHNEDVIVYNEALVDAAAAARCFVNDLYEDVRRCRFDPLSEDGIHFNETGKEYAGAVVAAYLQGLLT